MKLLPRLNNWSALRSCCHKLSPEVYTCTLHIACEHAKVEASHSDFLYAGLRVVEVAHDIQIPVSSYITKTLNLVNSFDTWHGE